MHFLMAAAGSAGDVYPFIAIGRALRQRGHDVELLASHWFEKQIAAADLGFVPAGAPGDYERLVASPDLWHPRRGFELIARELEIGLPAACESARSRVRTGTVLVGSTLSWNLRLLQEQLGLPAASVHLSPSCIVSALAPPVLPGVGDLARLPAWAVAALQRLGERLILDATVAPGLNRIRAGMNLPPVRRIVSRWMHSPDLVIAAWPAWFAAPQADWPSQSVATGFPFWNRAEAAVIDPALEGFLQAGPPPVGITPGSAMAHGRSFFSAALKACQALGRRALLITPYADQLPDVLPTGCHHVAYAPFESVVPRLAALVHHGGIGTSAQALAAGVPQLLCPFAHDQFDNAARLKRLGVGRIVARQARARRWVDALAWAVDDEAVRAACSRRAAAMRGSVDGVTLIADQLETLAARRQAI